MPRYDWYFNTRCCFHSGLFAAATTRWYDPILTCAYFWDGWQKTPTNQLTNYNLLRINTQYHHHRILCQHVPMRRLAQGTAQVNNRSSQIPTLQYNVHNVENTEWASQRTVVTQHLVAVWLHLQGRQHNSLKVRHLQTSQPSTSDQVQQYNSPTAFTRREKGGLVLQHIGGFQQERERAWSQLLQWETFNKMADTQPSPAAAAATAGTEATEANSQTHRTVTDYKETRKEWLPKRGQNNTPTNQARHPQEEWSRTTTRHSDTSSPTISTREGKTGGGLFRRSTWLRTTENKHVTIPHKQQSRQRKVHSRKEIPSNNE